MSGSKRIPTDGGQNLVQNPFASLSIEGLPAAPEPPMASAVPSAPVRPQKNRGRVEIRRTTAHRGGKTVTVVSGFVGIGLPEKEKLAKAMQKACGTGGTVKEGTIEIQGDHAERLVQVLKAKGFDVKRSGG